MSDEYQKLKCEQFIHIQEIDAIYQRHLLNLLSIHKNHRYRWLGFESFKDFCKQHCREMLNNIPKEIYEKMRQRESLLLTLVGFSDADIIEILPKGVN